MVNSVVGVGEGKREGNSMHRAGIDQHDLGVFSRGDAQAFFGGNGRAVARIQRHAVDFGTPAASTR